MKTSFLFAAALAVVLAIPVTASAATLYTSLATRV